MDTSPQRDKDEAQTEHFLWFVPTRSSLRVAGCAAKGVLAMLVELKVGCLWLPCHAGTLPRLESLGSSDCKTHLTPSQGGDETPLEV